MTDSRTYDTSADGVVNRCGATHDTSYLTGLACERSEGHSGDHEGWVPVTWPQEDAK